MNPNTTRLVMSCLDRRGIIAAVTGFLAPCGGNVLEADQHIDPNDGSFCMRLEFETDALTVSPAELSVECGGRASPG